MNILTKTFGYTTEEFKAIKEYVETKNDIDMGIDFEYKGMSITNPFIDESARFDLTDDEMIKKYGKENLQKFFKEIMNCIS